ncbi:Glutamate receptor ionotropic NMDA 2A, partial [Taenia solium]
NIDVKQEVVDFIYGATVLKYRTSRDDGCKLKTVGNQYATTGCGIGFLKGSRWLPKINFRVLHYRSVLPPIITLHLDVLPNLAIRNHYFLCYLLVQNTRDLPPFVL